MRKISKNLYLLPLDSEIFSIGKTDDTIVSECLSDEIFMWSILVLSDNKDDPELIHHYWTHTSKPICCALAAMVVYERFLELPFVHDELKLIINKQKG